MAVLDLARKTITLKIVYCGCALSGKTTNVVSLHRLTSQGDTTGLVSINTRDDRTLFFDLLPMDLGRIGDFNVLVKVYTVPGQPHYEVTRRQVLAGTDGVVLVMDSAPAAVKANPWAAENLRFNLKANAINPDQVPLVIQWNKQDLPDARDVNVLEAELNSRKVPSYAAVATTGAGVVETFAAVVKAAIRGACAKTGTAVSAEAVDTLVDTTLKPAADKAPPGPGTNKPKFEHRMDTDAYQARWAEEGRDRHIVDQETLLAESVKTSMELAERLDGFSDTARTGEAAVLKLAALSHLVNWTVAGNDIPVPPGLMAALLAAAGRKRGSLLFFRPNERSMEERDVVPPGRDPLNLPGDSGGDTAAHLLCHAESARVIPDIAGEVFFDRVPPEAATIAAAMIAPIACDGVKFGAFALYAEKSEPPFGAADAAFWATTAALMGLSLHWRVLRRRAAQPGVAVGARSAAGSAASPRT